MKIKKEIILSLAFGVLAAFFSALFLHYKSLEIAGGSSLERVVTAVRDISANTLLNPRLVAYRKVPKTFITPGALQHLNEISGKVTTVPIKKGEQLSITKVVYGTNLKSLSSKVDEGKRAVSICLGREMCAGGLIKADDHVDILVTFNFSNGAELESETKTLFQDVLVLAVDEDQNSLEKPSGVPLVSKAADSLFSSPSGLRSFKDERQILTFELRPDEVEQLIYAGNVGKVFVSLRGNADHGIYKGSVKTTSQSVFGRTVTIKRNFNEYRGGS